MYKMAASDTLAFLVATLAVIGLIAIVALVLSAIAYTNMSLRTARRDAFFYALSRNPIRLPGGTPAGAELFSQQLNDTIAPGQTSVVTTLALDTMQLGPNPPSQQRLSLVTSANIAQSANMASGTQATATIGFAGYTSNLVLTTSNPSVDNVLIFTLNDVLSGAPQSVVVTNTGSLPITITHVRVLAGSV